MAFSRGGGAQSGLAVQLLLSLAAVGCEPAVNQSAVFPPQNFLDNFPSSDPMVFVARAFLLFQMISVYPLLGYLVRVQLMGQIFGSPYPR